MCVCVPPASSTAAALAPPPPTHVGGARQALGRPRPGRPHPARGGGAERPRHPHRWGVGLVGVWQGGQLVMHQDSTPANHGVPALLLALPPCPPASWPQPAAWWSTSTASWCSRARMCTSAGGATLACLGAASLGSATCGRLLPAQQVVAEADLVCMCSSSLLPSTCHDLPRPSSVLRSLERQHLPVHSSALAEAHEAARAAAFAKFDKERFGSSVEALRAALEAAVEREYRWALCWAVKGAGLVLCTLANHAPHTHPALHSTACLLSPLTPPPRFTAVRARLPTPMPPPPPASVRRWHVRRYWTGRRASTCPPAAASRWVGCWLGGFKVGGGVVTCECVCMGGARWRHTSFSAGA